MLLLTITTSNGLGSSGADIIAMGAAFGVFTCGGPVLDYRAGRKDAVSAGSFGVPQPQEDLPTHTESFRRQGFTSTEMIALVACGHTVAGGVRSADFPQIVAPVAGNTITLSNFDTTSTFDSKMRALATI